MTAPATPAADTNVQFQCDACGAPLKDSDQFRSDTDGFTGCMPCFPVSNKPEDGDRCMRGPCYRGRATNAQVPA